MSVTNGKAIFNSIPEGKSYTTSESVDQEWQSPAREARAHRITGFPEPGKTIVYDDSEKIDLENVTIPDGGFLVKTIYLSIDPYMRGRMRRPEVQSYSPAYLLGQPTSGHGVGVILKSKTPEFKEGDHVYGLMPHQNYTVYPKNIMGLIVLDNKHNLPWSYFVGVCGMPGKTAYMAWKEYSSAKKGETVFVSGGAGPVGSFVIQLAKMDGCKVIASAGSEEKVEFMKSVGADVAFNYKTESTREVLKKNGPIDIYWDNVGGETLDAAFEAATLNARFIECGMISGYNGAASEFKNIMSIVAKSISMFGFIVSRLEHKYVDAFYKEVPELVASGKIKFKEQFYEGLESVGTAMFEVQKGLNKAKAVIRVSEE